MLVRRVCSLERAAARVCREAGARVATNVFLRDLNLGLPLTDGRRLEVVANGPPVFGGMHVAVDVTRVSPLGRDGSSRVRAALEPNVLTCTGGNLRPDGGNARPDGGNARPNGGNARPNGGTRGKRFLEE